MVEFIINSKTWRTKRTLPISSASASLDSADLSHDVLMKRLVVVFLVPLCSAVFNPYSDLYAKPQYHLTLPTASPAGTSGQLDGYITPNEAQLLQASADSINPPFQVQRMILNGENYICTLPILSTEQNSDQEADALTKSMEKKMDEYIRTHAKTKALELLQPLAADCLYYREGYFVYAVCYGNQVVQFHPVPYQIDQNPVAEEGGPIFVLGRFDSAMTDAIPEERIDIAVQNSGGSNYFTLRLGGGTVCDLTGINRTVEVQFHCNARVNADRIAWVKEVKTCHYEIAVYTPRLCTDPAFAAPKETNVETIGCRKIVDVETLRKLTRQRLELPAGERHEPKDINSAEPEVEPDSVESVDSGFVSSDSVDSGLEAHSLGPEVQSQSEHESEADTLSESSEEPIAYVKNVNEDQSTAEKGQEQTAAVTNTDIPDKPHPDYHIVYLDSKIQMDIPSTKDVVSDLRMALNALLEDILNEIERGEFKVNEKVVSMDSEFVTMSSLVDPSGQLIAHLLISFEKDYLRLELVSDKEVLEYQQDESL